MGTSRSRTSQPASEPIDRRLSRLRRACVEGNLAGAELELHGWMRECDCPIEARILLAALLARRGRTRDAIALAWPHRDILIDHPEGAALLLALLHQADRSEDAASISDTVRGRYAHAPQTLRRLDALLSSDPGTCELDAGLAQKLTRQLQRKPGLIPTLVAAQRHQPCLPTIALLGRAIEPLAQRFKDGATRLMVCQALARLAQLAGDNTRARHWAQQGLSLDPYCADLAILLAEVGSSDTNFPSPAQVLERVVEANPTYPDLRMALIQRAMHEGRTDHARLHLSNWLAQQPDHPLALEMQKELAA